MNLSKNGASSDDLRAQVDALRADLSRLTSSASGYASEKSRALAHGISEGFETARDVATKRGREAKDTVEGAVLANPLAAIGIAAGVGYLLGVLTRR